MQRVRYSFRVALLFVILLGALAGVTAAALAQAPSRQTTIVVAYTEYEWWLISWTDNFVLCQILTDHEGLPTGEDVYKTCGPDLYAEWVITPPCQQLTEEPDDSTICTGLYLHLISSQPKTREVVVELPTPTVWVELEGCTPIPPDNRCSQLPVLVLVGEEPLPNERIIAINGFYNGQPFYCEGSRCALPLGTTPIEGIVIEFWADSSYGDSTEHYTAHVRVIDSGVPATPGAGGFYVDVLSRQWRGEQLTSCAKTWEAFPPVGGEGDWLATPDHSVLLASDEAYYYLAGRLISQGLVDVFECPGGGLLANGYADTCGLEKARPLVEVWQNQFDATIVSVAQESGVPAQLLKNLFAQESQFWPGVFRVPWEFGLGQITDYGTDVILLWNESFFRQFCPLVLAQEVCALGYLHLYPEEQALLRGALAIEAKADCPECPSGVDLSNTTFNISLFANTLRANCEQVAQIVYNATKETAGRVSKYENLWRFTIANYHAGAGCLSYAIHTTWNSGGDLVWDQVAQNFTPPCQGVIPYVEKITQWTGGP